MEPKPIGRRRQWMKGEVGPLVAVPNEIFVRVREKEIELVQG
jgi:hypothetical protein